MDMVMGGMQPKMSSRGRQRHWPYFLVVIQAKQGQHQKAKQPSPGKRCPENQEMNTVDTDTDTPTNTQRQRNEHMPFYGGNK